MEKHVERLLNRISFAFTAIATLSLLHLFFRFSFSCAPSLHLGNLSQSQTLTILPFPSSSCEAASRRVISPEKLFYKLRSTRAFKKRARSFSSVFIFLRSLGLLSNASHVLCVSAGAGHEIAALQDSGVADVTGVEVFDFPPLVKRADPHNLPFFDGVFDLGFSTGFGSALFPRRFVQEIERTVRLGGATALAIDDSFLKEGSEDVARLFRASSIVQIVRIFVSQQIVCQLEAQFKHHLNQSLQMRANRPDRILDHDPSLRTRKNREQTILYEFD